MHRNVRVPYHSTLVRRSSSTLAWCIVELVVLLTFSEVYAGIRFGWFIKLCPHRNIMEEKLTKRVVRNFTYGWQTWVPKKVVICRLSCFSQPKTSRSFSLAAASKFTVHSQFIHALSMLLPRSIRACIHASKFTAHCPPCDVVDVHCKLCQGLLQCSRWT